MAIGNNLTPLQTTTELKKLSIKLDTIEENAQVNLIEHIKVNNVIQSIVDKTVDITVPTHTSQLTNNSNFVVDASYVHTDNNFSTTEKNKLSGITDGATKVQSSSINGNIKINDVETTVYTKPVLTSSEVITALGYTPAQPYTAGSGINIDSNNNIINAGVRSIDTGTTNGTISVNTNGTSVDVSVYGLGSLAYKSSLTAGEVGAIPTSSLGIVNGVAQLDSSGKVPESQLPSYVDDIIEGYYYENKFYEDSTHTTEITGESGKIYVDLETNKTYRYSGSGFVVVSETLALGTTSSTAFRGDYGNIAYTHAVTNKGSAFESGLYKITTNSEGHVTAATAVTKSDITNLGVPSSDTTYSFAEGNTNGAFSVTPLNGSATSVSIHGLNNAAYKDIDTSLTTTSTSTNLPTSAAVASLASSIQGCSSTATSLTCTLPDNL